MQGLYPPPYGESVNVRFHQKRSFNLVELSRFDRPLSAKSGRSLTKENPATRAGLVRTSAFDPKQLLSAQAHRRAVFAQPCKGIHDCVFETYFLASPIIVPSASNTAKRNTSFVPVSSAVNPKPLYIPLRPALAPVQPAKSSATS